MHNSIVRNIEANSLIARIFLLPSKDVWADSLKNICDSDTQNFFDKDIRIDDISFFRYNAREYGIRLCIRTLFIYICKRG